MTHIIFLLISIGLDYQILTWPMNIRKGFQEEEIAKQTWVKGEVQGKRVFQDKRAAGHLAPISEGSRTGVG